MATTITNMKALKNAIRFASRDKHRPILRGVWLAENGDMVATDAYRLLVVHGACSGEAVHVPIGLARQVAKSKSKSAVVTDDGTTVRVKLDDGTELEERAEYGKYPDYTRLMGGGERTVAYVDPKRIAPILKGLKDVHISVADRDLYIGGEVFEKHCDGDDAEIKLNAAFLRDALAACGKIAELHIESSLKPMRIVSDEAEAIIMPIRIDSPAKKPEPPKVKPEPPQAEKGQPKKAEPKKEERMDKPITCECYGRSFYSSRPKGEEVRVCNELVFVVGDAYKYRVGGREYAAACLGYDYYRGEQKVLFAVFDGAEWQGYLRTVDWSKLKRLNNNRIGEAVLASEAVDEGAQTEASEPVETAAQVTLETLRERFGGKDNVAVTQKREGTPIWVEGDTRQLRDELMELGFKWAPKRKGWYLKTA